MPDFAGRVADIHTVVDSRLDVFAHNIECVEDLTWLVRDPRAKYRSGGYLDFFVLFVFCIFIFQTWQVQVNVYCDVASQV